MDFKLIARLLSLLFTIFSVGLLLPLATAIFYDTENILNFVVTLAISGSLSYGLRRYGSGTLNQKLRIREAFVLLTFGWTMICVMGTIPYAMVGTMDLTTSFFESTASFTTTEVCSADSYDFFPPSILVWRGLAHWAGALGVIMMFIIVMPQMNSGVSHLFNAELPSVVADRTVPKIKEAAFLVFKIYNTFFWFEVLLLWLIGTPFLKSVNYALLSMSTGGFSYYYNGEFFAFENLGLEIICLIFMIIGSTNFSLYYKIWRRDWQAVKEDTEHRYFYLYLVLAGLVMSLDLYFTNYYDFSDSFYMGFMHSISFGTTTGLAYADFDKWPGISRMMIFIMMFIGGCSGSSAGGIKVGRVVVLLKASWAELKRTLHPNMVYTIKMGDRVIAPEVVRNVTRFFFMYLFVFAILSLVISMSGIGILDSMGIIAACLSSVGLSSGIVGPSTLAYNDVPNFAKFIACIAMLLGRIEIFGFLVVLNPDFWRNKANW